MHDFDLATMHTADFWDDHYGGSDPVWSGHANQRLVEQVGVLSPGDALDIGCGEGGDAAWLAARGWRVTAVDVSSVVVERAAAYAGLALDTEVAARITWRQADTLSWQPPPSAFDLVSLQFVHLPSAALLDLQARLARSIRPGGTLLVVNHDVLDLQATAGRPDVPEAFLSADDVAATLDAAKWEVQVAQRFPRPFTDHHGNPGTIHDAVVRARRNPNR